MSQTTQFRVTDFDCPTCASTVERALANTEGVEDVTVHFTTGRVEIAFDQTVADTDGLAEIIENQGYTPRVA